MAMKFRAHDTFFIRKGWLSKGMKYVCNKPDVFVDKNDNPMETVISSISRTPRTNSRPRTGRCGISSTNTSKPDRSIVRIINAK